MVDALGGVLVQDCEALLDGHYVERLIAVGLPVPPWAWMNLLAHGSEADLRRAGGGMAGHPSVGLRDFHEARARVAADVLAVAAEVGSLSALQAAVLVPMELAMADTPGCRCWSATRWEHAVRSVLADGCQ